MHRSDRAATRTSGRSVRAAARAAVAALVAVPVVALVLALGSTRADAASCSEAVAAGQVRIVIVVDPGAGGSPSAACLVVPAGTTGAQALARRASELGASAPRYNGSGLLCAIDGHPSTGCGDRNSGGYLYWAYFTGSSGSWVYGNFNPFTRRLVDGDIEGWRFVDGAGDGSEPPPRLAPSRGLFPAESPATEPPATGTGSFPGGDRGGVVAAPDPTAPDTGAASSPSSVAAPTSGSGDGTGVVAVELASVPVGSGGSSSSLLPVVLVVVVIAAVGTAAFLRSRARR